MTIILRRIVAGTYYVGNRDLRRFNKSLFLQSEGVSTDWIHSMFEGESKRLYETIISNPLKRKSIARETGVLVRISRHK